MRDHDYDVKIYLPENGLSTPSLTDGLDRILGKHRLDIFSASTFTRNAQTQARRKTAVPLIFFAGAGVLALNIPLLFYKTYIGMAGLVIGVALLGWSFTLKNKPSSDSFGKLLEGAKNPAIAQIILDWASWFLNSNIPILQIDKNGNSHPIPNAYREASNMVLVLLGDDRHRQALGVKDRISDAPFLYRAEDRNRIFRPLIEALSLTPDYAHFEKNTSVDTAEEKQSNQKNREQHSAYQTSNARLNEYDEYHFEVRSKDARQYDYFISVLLSKELLKLFLDKAESKPYFDAYIKINPKRKIWVNVFRFLYENWAIWELYRDKISNDETKEFASKLFGPEYLNHSDGVRQEKFRRGHNTYINKLIGTSGSIKKSQLLKDKTIK